MIRGHLKPTPNSTTLTDVIVLVLRPHDEPVHAGGQRHLLLPA